MSFEKLVTVTFIFSGIAFLPAAEAGEQAASWEIIAMLSSAKRHPDMSFKSNIDSVCCCTSSGGMWGAQCCTIGAKHQWTSSEDCSKFGLATCEAKLCQ